MSKDKPKNWVVEVTYGTRKHSVYATVPSRDSAEKLKACAIGLGYADARVIDEESFNKAQAASRSG